MGYLLLIGALIIMMGGYHARRNGNIYRNWHILAHNMLHADTVHALTFLMFLSLVCAWLDVKIRRKE